MTARPKRGPSWTADTEIAFLLALRLTGGIEAACREIGRSAHGARERRKKYPAFAAKWQAILDEKHWEAIATEKAKRAAIDPADLEPDTGEMPNRIRYDGWTPLRQRAFLRALTETGKVEKACMLAGISKTSALRMRNRYPSFAAAWDRALAKSEPTLEQVAVDRAVNGVSEPVWHGGKVVGHKRRYSDALLRDALRREDARLGTHKDKSDLIADARASALRAGGWFYEPATSEETNRAILWKIAKKKAFERRQAAAAAERLLAAGLVP